MWGVSLSLTVIMSGKFNSLALNFEKFGKSSKVIKKCYNMLNTWTALQCPKEPAVWEQLSEPVARGLTQAGSILSHHTSAPHWVAFAAEMPWRDKTERLNHLFLPYWEALQGVRKSHPASKPSCTCCTHKENSRFHCYLSSWFPIKRRILKCWDLSEMSCTAV